MIYDIIPHHLLILSDDYYVAFLTFTSRIILEWLYVAEEEVINPNIKDQEAIVLGSDMLRFNHYRSILNDITDDDVDNDLYLDQTYYLYGEWKHRDISKWSNRLGVNFMKDEYSNISKVSSAMIRSLIYDNISLKGLKIIGYMP